MRKVIVLAMFIACCASLSLAQSGGKVEGFAGFSVDSMDVGLRRAGTGALANANNRETGYGFDTSVTGYVNNNVGIEGNVDGHYKTKTFNIVTCQAIGCPPSSFDTKFSTYNFMGGPHVRIPTSNAKVTPYVHALLGGNYTKADTNVSAFNTNNSETDFALKLGGGIDFGVSQRAAIRLSGDYNPIFQKDGSNLNPNVTGRRTRNDAVFSVGVVFH